MNLGVPELARELPKVELHCHLEGAARPSTIADLARANGVSLPTDDPVELFEFSDLDSFLAVYGIICASLVTADDFRRLTYEALEDAVAANVRYREMFFSPGFAMAIGVPVTTVWDGIRAGLADAHHDLDVRCRMILDVDKPAGPGPAAELVEFAGAQDRDLLIGVGGDSTERGVDHRAFAPVFARARELGLHRTFHAGEDGPADNIAAAVDDLGVERVDHGFRLLDDPELTRRVADARHPAHRVSDQQRGDRQRDRRRRAPPVRAATRGRRPRHGELGRSRHDGHDHLRRLRGGRRPLRLRAVHDRGHCPRRDRRELGATRRTGGAAHPVPLRDGRRAQPTAARHERASAPPTGWRPGGSSDRMRR